MDWGKLAAYLMLLMAYIGCSALAEAIVGVWWREWRWHWSVRAALVSLIAFVMYFATVMAIGVLTVR